ncbi:MAG: hypothetical protein PHV43_00750 [Candidatus Colwellbacteria bacterium]|nr:hypothetical protein [Candidatus Colwellbacteria bacterium]
MIVNVLLYLASLAVIWFGAGLIIKSIDRIAHSLKLSSFAVSFFLLGILTSIPETAISATAIADHNPEIFVGILLGGTIVLFLLIIPFLAVFGGGIRINHDLSRENILLTLAVIAMPGLFVLDHRVTNLEGIALLASYAVLFYFLQRKHGILDHNSVEAMALKRYSFLDLLKVGLGVGIVFLSSQYIVNQTIALSQAFDISAFYISLLVLSVGTNLPELSLAMRAILSKKKDIAFGDYLGSAVVNTLLFGFFTLINDGEVLTINSFFITFLFILSGLGMFYFFSKSRRNISVREGVILFGVYFLFVIYELSRGLLG